MSTKIVNFPVQASTLAVTVQDDTANGVTLAQSGDTLTISDNTPPVIKSVTVTGPGALAENATAQFTATVNGSGNFNPGVQWSCTDGVISQTGLFTAPAKIENVVVTATSVQDPTKSGSQPVAISNPTNTVKIAPSGGDDTAALQAALNKTAQAKQILEMTVGTWHLNPIQMPGGVNLLIDPGVLITDQSAYAPTACMFNFNSANALMTATGAFAQMPLSFAQSQKDKQEFRHCVAIGEGGAASNVAINGLSISEPGGDCIYVRNCTNVVLSNISTTKAYRNNISLTGKINGFIGNNVIAIAALRAGVDHEPNLPTDFMQNIVWNNLSTGQNPGGGTSVGIYALDKTSLPVSITFNGYRSENDGNYGFFFTNGSASSPGGEITVNNAKITGSGFGGAYGRYMASGPQITFNGLVIIDSNQNGTDPHYGMNSACGVDLTGGQNPPCGGANFNIATIANSTGRMVNYFQQGNQGGNAQNTTFKAQPGGSMSGATNPNAVTKYP
jgi:hypothetical protein